MNPAYTSTSPEVHLKNIYAGGPSPERHLMVCIGVQASVLLKLPDKGNRVGSNYFSCGGAHEVHEGGEGSNL